MTQDSKNGSAVNWERAFAQHGRWLRTVAHSRLRDSTAVEEVMQEAALAAVRQSAPLKDTGKLAPWLYRLVVRQVLLYRRRCGRQKKLAEGFASSMADEGTRPSPLEWLLAKERQQLTRDALDRLPPRDAEILLLKYTENWKYDQIANHLGVSCSAVESRLHRARRRLRSELAELKVIEASR